MDNAQKFNNCLVGCWCPEKGPSYIDWAQLSMLSPEDIDRIQSLKRCFK
jgi:hypothetical protein